MQQYHVYGLGAALVDTEITVTDQNLVDLGVDKGLMTLVDQQRQQQLIDYLSDHLIAARRASGGSAANTIIASSYFGASAFYSCKVAADDNGAFYLQDLRAAGVDYHHNGALEDGITGKCLVMITPDAERSMNTFLGISEALSVNELHEDAVKASQYAYIEGYLVTSDSGRAAAIRLREVAEENGVKTAISLSDPAIVEFFRDGLQEMAGSGVDLLFCNKAEALGFTATDSLAAAVESLKAVAKNFAITLGADGALVYDGSQLIEIDAHAVEAIDSNGAGDMFAGAYLYAITHGFSARQAGQLASYACSVVVSQYGPRLRPQQHEEIRRRILQA